MRHFGAASALGFVVVLAACASQPARTYDLVIASGRVMDPESGLDAVRHVGIRARRAHTPRCSASTCATKAS